MQRVDTVKSLVLDPTQLGTVKAAEALAAKADSTRQALTQTLQSIQVKPVVDSATALANRLAKTDPGKLGVTGVAGAVTDVKRNIDQIEQTEKQLEDLEKNVNSSVDGAQSGTERRGRGASAGLRLRQGSPQSSAGLSLRRSARPLRSTEPGLLPEGALLRPARPAVSAARTAAAQSAGSQASPHGGHHGGFSQGTRVSQVPARAGRHRFRLRRGYFQGQFKAALTGLTTQPALYGKPATLAASGKIALATPLVVEIKGLSDHVSGVPKDQAEAQLQGVPLPKLSVPGLPFSVSPGVGNADFSFALTGDRISGKWSILANHAEWVRRLRESGELRPGGEHHLASGLGIEPAHGKRGAWRNHQRADSQSQFEPGQCDREPASGHRR